MAINEPVYLCDKKEFTTCLVTRGCEKDACLSVRVLELVMET